MKNDYRLFETAKEKFRECSVGPIYDKVVLSDGNKDNPIVMVCGEAPGKDEVAEGFPFVGRAGQLLRSSVNKYGFRRKNTLITNIIPCRPENNKFPSDMSLVKSCMARWLLNEIDIIKPKYMLLVGAKPLYFLLGMTGITNLRGEWYTLPDHNVECLPTFHSSYVLRKQYTKEGDQIKKHFLSDIRKVALRAELIK